MSMVPGMSECSEVEPLLAAYVDNEVAPGDLGRLQAHLAACPGCRRRVAGEGAARELLHARRHELVRQAPAHLHKRCAACVCGPASRRTFAPTRWIVSHRWLPLSFAATVVLAIAAVFFTTLNGSVEALATQLALDHVKCFQFAPAHAEVDPIVASSLWKKTYGWLISVPTSAPVEQLELLDVRRCMSTHGASAHIMYRWRGQPLSVYVLNSAGGFDPHDERLVSRLGQKAVIWSDAGRTYAVVGRAPPNDLEHIAHYLRASAR
jgi:anti-sigma factor RsiW